MKPRIAMAIAGELGPSSHLLELGHSNEESMNLFEQTDREIAVDVLHSLTAIYTHESVVDELLDSLTWPQGDERLLDPSVGAGAFICRALERLLLAQPDINDAKLVHVIQGWEIHPFAVSEARAQVARLLQGTGRSQAASHELARSIVHEGDFLLQVPADEVYHAICTNPPYLRMLNVPEPLREDYLRVVPDYAQGDLLHCFLDWCARLLAPGGEISLITSDRWLINEGSSKLRTAMGAKLGVAHVERVDVESAFYRPKMRRKGTPPRVHPVLVVMKHRDEAATELGSKGIHPGAEALGDCSGPTLGSVATVRIAPWLGTPGVFVIDAEMSDRFAPGDLVPAVDTDDIKAGMLGPVTKFALRTCKDQLPSPSVLNHLDENLHRMCERGRRATRWVPPESFESFDLSKEYLLVPRIAKTLRPIRIPAGHLPINHNLSVVSNGSHSLDELEEILTSPEAQAWVQAMAPRLEGGYLSITTRFLRGLPVGLRT